ncbi:MAG: signal peptidase I [Gammaproteobacteria bacterium]
MTQPADKKNGRRNVWREYRNFALFAFLLLAFRSAWADWVHVPTGSMNPTILEGDRLLVDKHVFGVRVPWTLVRLTSGRDPMRGEIVVFDSPADGTSLVKRVIAVPGDIVSLDENGLMVNGRHAHYAPGDAQRLQTLLAATTAMEPRIFHESGFGPQHDILQLPHRYARRFVPPLRVPDNMYFMMGDNRDNSADSRYFGFVPRRNIVGHATRVAFSLNPEHYYLPRGSRTLTSIE